MNLRSPLKIGCLTLLLGFCILAVVWYCQLESDTPQRLGNFMNAVGVENFRNWAMEQMNTHHLSNRPDDGTYRSIEVEPAAFFKRAPEFTNARLTRIKVGCWGRDTEDNQFRRKHLLITFVLYQAGSVSQHALWIMNDSEAEDFLNPRSLRIAEGIWYQFGGSR